MCLHDMINSLILIKRYLTGFQSLKDTKCPNVEWSKSPML